MEEVDPSQQFIQQDMPVSPNDIYAGYLQEEKVANLIAQTSPDNQLVEIEWRIKGYRKDPFTKEWKKISDTYIEPNEILIGRYIAYLSSILNENTRFTNLSAPEINLLMKQIIEWLTDDLTVNAELYGLGDDYTERSRIGQIILNQTFLVLKRSMDGMESRRIFKALSLAENLGGQIPRKSSWTDALKFWKS